MRSFTTFCMLSTISLLPAWAQHAHTTGACLAPPSGLVSWWPGDSNENDIVGGNNPSTVNAVTLVPGEVLDGFTFGKGGYIYIPPSANLANQQFTWSAWVRPDGPGPNNDKYGSVIISQNIDNTDDSVSLSWGATDNRFSFIFGSIYTEMITSADTFVTGTFYLVTGTYDGTAFRLFVNGLLEGSFSEAKTIPYSSKQWVIGATDPNVSSQGYPRTWNGVIDEVQAFSRALSQSEIQSIFNAASAGECKPAAIVANSWTAGAPMPTAVQGPAAGAVGGTVYVVGGATNSAAVNINQIYNPANDNWTTGAPMPTARYGQAGAVVNNILYVIGGYLGGNNLSVVEAFDPTSNTWSTKSPMPTPRAGVAAVVNGGIIYVIGGVTNGGGRLTTVESYNPATDTWAQEAPLPVGVSGVAAGLLGSTIVAAGGQANSGNDVTDTEGYNSFTNSWQTLAPDPTEQQAGCFSTISGQLYFAGGKYNGAPVNVVESFNLQENQWNTLAPMPLATILPGYAEVGNLLYCFGGSNNGGFGQGTVYNNVQIYHPSAPPTPAISAGGVVSASSFGEFTSVSPGSWIEIYGSNLAVDSRSWLASDFNGFNAPTSLDGTSVTIGGQAAFIDFISPGQVNALVPSNVATGAQPMTVTVGGATSTAYNINVNPAQPGLDAPASFNIGGTQYVVALFADGTYVLPTGAIAGLTSRPAQPGDEIVLYGVGFGPVTPNLQAGQLVQEANTLMSSLVMSVGGVPVTDLPYAGLAPGFTGLYQFNVVVPASPGNGAVPLTFTVGGVAGTQTLYLAVGN
jgi:uncharacterized protein (TIGR03437 family)